MISSLPAIPKAVEAIRRGTITPEELVEFCLERIRRFERQVQAWVSVDEEGSRREAKRLTDLASRGQLVGPLHGIPLGIKDIIDVAGWPTKCGSPLRGNRIAETDADVVQKLRDAGAIILGKTVTTEFASFDPPPTRNPWNLERTPGGSSSGSAAAVALEMCAAAIGTQTGGSIVRPASFCGVVGFKPSFGAVPVRGIEPLSWHMDHPGPIARTVEDATVLFQVLRRNAPPTEAIVKPPTLIRITGFFDQRADESVRRTFSEAVERLQAANIHSESPGDLGIDFAAILASHRTIMAVEAAEHHREAFAQAPDKFGPRIRSLIEEGLRTNVIDYAAALRHQALLQSDLSSLLKAGSVWIMPSTTTPAPAIDTTGDPAFNSLWSIAGMPEVTIPCGLSKDGLPCGIQFVGAAGSDLHLLSVAAVCEAILGFQERPDLSPSTKSGL